MTDPGTPPNPETLLAENARRMALIDAPYDPVAGDARHPGRYALQIPGLSDSPLLLPAPMRTAPVTAAMTAAGSLDAYIRRSMGARPSGKTRGQARRLFDTERARHDFPFWAASYARIKAKGGGEDVPFVLNAPQRRLVDCLEAMRLADRPIRLVLLKARQWGGSTCVQLYMAWLQLVHSTGLNSLIVAHQGMATYEIKDMFDRMMDQYPNWLLTDGDGNECKGKRMETVGAGRSTFRIPARNCKIKLGSAERPDSSRGGDYNLLHCSEVGLWPSTRLRTPQQLMSAASSGILNAPMTMIVMESTANGVGNFFHTEYLAASQGISAYSALFIPWFEIERYRTPLADPRAFAQWLLDGREATNALNEREQPGQYLWHLWQTGATLEAINWYVGERRKYSDHGRMASEFPSDDIEAFVNSGARVFDRYRVEQLRAGCRTELMRGEIDGDEPSGPGSLRNLRFNPSANGMLRIWRDRELPQEGTRCANRYLVVVDIGGRGAKADWSVIAVFDRMGMARGEPPEIVAQWRGHTDIDLLAWNAARIAAYYDDALLVIESNTLDTHDPDRMTDGDQSHYILNQIRRVYPNLYARRQSEEAVRQGAPTRYGFHTNTSTKPMVITGLIKAVREGLYVERDSRCLDEFEVYEQRPNGSYGALSGYHDDMLMTRAIGLHVCFTEMELPRTAVQPARRPRPYSF